VLFRSPETQEEKDWILKHGCKNGIVNSYLGLTCAQKGEMLTALKREVLDAETFAGIGIIIDALFDEGPSAGISAYECADEAITLYLSHAEKLCTNTENLNIVLNIKAYYEKENKDASAEIIKKCEQIINMKDWRDISIKEIESGDRVKFSSAWTVAENLAYNIDEALWQYIEKNPLECAWYTSTLLRNPEYQNKVIDLYLRVLPLDKIASGMGNQMGFGKDFKSHSSLGLILQNISPYPMIGTQFIKTGFASPVIRNRNMSCNVLEAWQKKLEKPISDFFPEIEEQIKELIPIEIDEKLKERYQKILT
jgi:hypothetical protein